MQALHFFLPRHVAGVEIYTDRLARQLAREHDVALLFTDIRPNRPHGEVLRDRWAGLATYEIVANRRHRTFEDSYRDSRLEGAIREVLDEWQPDVVHVQHLMGLGLTLLDELKRRGIPVVTTAHDHWLECAAGGQRFHPDLGYCSRLEAARCGGCTAHMSGAALRLRNAIERRAAGSQADEIRVDAAPQPAGSVTGRTRELLRRGIGAALGRRHAKAIELRWDAVREAVAGVDKVLVPSRYLAGELEAFGIDRERIAFCETGFERERFRARRALPDVARRFGFLGSLVKHKGVGVLLEAFASLPADAVLEVSGEDRGQSGYGDELRRLARHPGIHFRGPLPPDEVPRFLASLDCVVVPSLWPENSSLVVREAHLAGVPVVASRMGGNPELLEEGGGLLVEAGSTAALAEALRRLAGEPGLARRLAETAPTVRSIDDQADETAALYRALVEGGSAKGFE